MKSFFWVVFKDVPGQYAYHSERQIFPGDLVKAPFRQGEKIGVITEIITEKIINFPTKEAILLLQKALGEEQIFLGAKISSYYFCPLGKALALFFPPEFWKKLPPVYRTNILKKKSPLELQGVSLQKSQQEILEKISEEGVFLEDFLQTERISRDRVKRLERKGAVYIEEGKIIPNPQIKKIILPDKNRVDKELNQEQIKSLNEILNTSQKKFLLFGITGSGKTEVYLQIAKRMRERGKKTMVLVPEISLTPTLISYFANDFPNLSLIHSKVSGRNRSQEFFRIREGESDLIIGSRLALFSPVKDLGAIILDEEHEWTYKNDMQPRYDTRRCAEFLATRSNSLLVLASATPSIENFYRAEKGELKRLDLRKRAKKSSLGSENKMPKVEVIDLKKERANKNYSLLSTTLLNKIRLHLSKKKSVLLFLNRRGYFSTLSCLNCGENAKCPHCDFSLVLHSAPQKKPRLMCHYCGHLENPIAKCSHCNSKELRYFSAGTQNLTSELKEFFPKAKVVRIDSDSMAGKGSFIENINSLLQAKADIFVGTQILAKGFDIDKISLVGVVLADLGLSIPDFRSSERVFSLLTQVAGRTGRGKDRGQVVIQTFSPFHSAISCARNHDYESYFRSEIALRQKDFFPPFSEIVKFIFVDPEKKRAFSEATNFFSYLNREVKQVSKEKIEVFFAPALVPKKHKKFHFHVFLKGKDLSPFLDKIIIPKRAKIDRNPVFMG